MNEIPWGTPENLKRMTILELSCLTSERPPGRKEKVATFEEYQANLERKRAEDEAWDA